MIDAHLHVVYGPDVDSVPSLSPDGPWWERVDSSVDAVLERVRRRGKAVVLPVACAAMSSDRPFRVLGIQQIAIGGLDVGALNRLWVDTLGIEKVADSKSESENVYEDILRLGSGPHAVEIDLMEPLVPGAKPKVYEPALNHVGLWVDDLPAAVEWLSAQGVRFAPGGIRPGAVGHDIAFLHPKGNDEFPLSGEGVLIELVQAPDDVIAALG